MHEKLGKKIPFWILIITLLGASSYATGLRPVLLHELDAAKAETRNVGGKVDRLGCMQISFENYRVKEKERFYQEQGKAVPTHLIQRIIFLKAQGKIYNCPA